jgi:hypothetical protein
VNPSNGADKLCKDCGMNTEPWPPRRGTQEEYIVRNEVWQRAGMPLGKHAFDGSLHGGGILCVGCIEKRLGRLLTIGDIEPATLDIVKYAPAALTSRYCLHGGR